jgi:hypothetical protein
MPGEDKEIESEIHRKVFDCELMRSSVFLNSIDEDDFEMDCDDAYEKLLEIEEASMHQENKTTSAHTISPYSTTKSDFKNPPDLLDRNHHRPETYFSEKKVEKGLTGLAEQVPSINQNLISKFDHAEIHNNTSIMDNSVG